MNYEIIYCDPPWDYKGQTQHNGKGGKDTGGATTHYGCMKLPELKLLNVPNICFDDCLMFMWSSSPHLDQAIDLLKSWGFKYATIAFIWDKKKVNPGFYTMSQCEIVLVGKRGKIPQPRGARNIRQFLSEMRGKHSVKPSEVRTRIEEMFPTQKKLEMFARETTEGWDVFGDELEDSITI
jgi:N6-adenosine-specific RNA methylase IME4